jgi:hypothetical protein
MDMDYITDRIYSGIREIFGNGSDVACAGFSRREVSGNMMILS